MSIQKKASSVRLGVLFGLSGPISFALAYGLIYAAAIPANVFPDIFWVLAIPGYLAGKAMGLALGWMLSIALILLFHLFPYFTLRPWASVVCGLITYYIIVISGLVLILRNSATFL